MARAKTAKFEQMVLEVEFDPTGSPGVYTNIAGITDVSITRQSNIDTSEVPDVDDESLPMALERAVRSQEVSASGSGVWALGSNKKMMHWWRSGATLNTRIRNVLAETDGAVGDPYQEQGPAILATLNNSRTKGQKVTAEIEIQWDGVPDVTDVAV